MLNAGGEVQQRKALYELLRTTPLHSERQPATELDPAARHNRIALASRPLRLTHFRAASGS